MDFGCVNYFVLLEKFCMLLMYSVSVSVVADDETAICSYQTIAVEDSLNYI